MFSIDGNNNEQTVWTFCAAKGDGWLPWGSLSVINGKVFGTTAQGGANACEFGRGCGTIFSFDPKTNIETPMYSAAAPTGDRPYGVRAFNGVLYGAMIKGGGKGSAGTVYSLTP